MEDISASNEYKDFETRNNRALNMLSDSDRNLRRQALTELTKTLKNESNDAIVTFFFRERLAKRLVIALEDQIEKNREMSIALLGSLIERVGLKDEAQIILSGIA